MRVNLCAERRHLILLLADAALIDFLNQLTDTRQHLIKATRQITDFISFRRNHFHFQVSFLYLGHRLFSFSRRCAIFPENLIITTAEKRTQPAHIRRTIRRIGCIGLMMPFSADSTRHAIHSAQSPFPGECSSLYSASLFLYLLKV